MNKKPIGLFFTVSLFLPILAAVAGSWPVETRIDPASYQSVVQVSATSIESISDEYGVKKVKPRLEFYCTPGSASAVSVRINWLRFISSFNTEVTFLADDQEPLTLKLGVDRSNKVTATRAAEDDKAIIAALSGQQMLLIRVTPYSEAPVEVKFDLDELDKGLAQLRQACTDAN